MRVVVFSDIHGNRLALDAALAEIRRDSIDKIVCLGDTVQGGAQPYETIEELRALSCPIVMGNADAWLLNEESDSAEPTSQEQRDVRAWTLLQLSSDDLAFIQSDQPTVEIDLGMSRRLICFYGSPHSYNDVLLPDTPRDEWDRMLGPFAPAIMTGGHTHTPQLRRIREGVFLNPGSIGLAYNYSLPKDQFHTDPWAEYAIISLERGHLGFEFKRAPYDSEELFRVIRASGRPHAQRMIDSYQVRL